MIDAGYVIPFLVAPVIGSFLGVLVRRIPRGEAFVTGRSRCESCHTTLGLPDLVPVLSWLALKGRCRHCGAAIATQHLLVELAACLVPVLTTGAYVVWNRLHGFGFHGFAAFAMMPDSVTFLFDCLLGWALMALCWIDLLCFRLPDVLTLPLLLTGLLDGFVAGGSDELWYRALGAVAGWVILAGTAWIYRHFRKRAGLGAGDAKLLAAAGAWTGLESVPTILVLASCAGLLLALLTAVRRKRFSLTLAIPFGPPLALATWLVRLLVSMT